MTKDEMSCTGCVYDTGKSRWQYANSPCDFCRRKAPDYYTLPEIEGELEEVEDEV